MQHREPYKGYVVDFSIEPARDDSGSGWTYSFHIEEHSNGGFENEGPYLASCLYPTEAEALQAAVRDAKHRIDSKGK